jgi:hypothetical protein
MSWCEAKGRGNAAFDLHFPAALQRAGRTYGNSRADEMHKFY